MFKKAPATKTRKARSVTLSERGAITVEYALGMCLAAFLMTGVLGMFIEMAKKVIEIFIKMVKDYPNFDKMM